MRLISTLASAIAFMIGSATAFGQTAPAPSAEKPAAAPQQQAAPAQPTATPPAKPPVSTAPAALVRLEFAQATGPKCIDVAIPTTADPGYKQVTVIRPKTGIPAGATTGINVPGKLGLDRVDANHQFVKGVLTCDGGMSFALKAIVTKATSTMETLVFMVPETIKAPFQIRSCSASKDGACAWGEFASTDQPVVLGDFVGGKVASK